MAQEREQVFFKISELSTELGVEAHVLRFWEKEFIQIRPMRLGPRKRLYRRKDLETFQEIKRLLYDERFTIAGAKKYLARSQPDEATLFMESPKETEGPTLGDLVAEAPLRSILDESRRELLRIRQILSKPLTSTTTPKKTETIS
ncbi:MAG: MerR family transcriptional regulator [Candidatus Adiutrix sp.]